MSNADEQEYDALASFEQRLIGKTLFGEQPLSAREVVSLPEGLPQQPADFELSAFSKEMLAALRYPLESGGKRVRPSFCLLLAQAIGSTAARENAMKAAKALELVHTYSLVHDDLPCMDNDDLRRGRPTSHKVYGEAKALLIGDGLLTEAFRIIAGLQTLNQPHLASTSVQILARAAGYQGMVAGQWLDLSMQGGTTIDYETLATMHLLKTGCLLGASFELGTLCGLNERELSTQSAAQLRELARLAGLEIGLAFQIVDDLLDASQSAQALGKTPGKDAVDSKQTALSLLGKNKAEIEAARVTESARHKLQQLFERLPALDDASEAARTSIFEYVTKLINRRS
jgi:geranylgeranyl pyrophosphate synthase